jgi:2-(1,2-epoxy-1,2-dihydrophenyl)acetyl-CoA isomerase
MAYETILLDIADGVATITLNRPERLNACSLPMAGEISDALDHLGDARVLVLKGAGRAFCSGADLQARGDRTTGAGEEAIWRCRALQPGDHEARPAEPADHLGGQRRGGRRGLLDRADGGLCGGGQERLFPPGVRQHRPGSRRRIELDSPRLIGKARATEMMMLGEKIGADKALDWGLIHKAVEDADLEAEVSALATRLAAGPTLAYATMRRNILTALEHSLAETLLAEAEGQRVAGNSADATEGGLAFLQKRKPAFTGR